MSPTSRKNRRLGRWLLPAIGAFWLLAFALLAWPSLDASRDNDALIAELDAQAAELDNWLAVAPRNRPDVARWASVLDSRFETLFPRKAKLQELYYELTRIANENGIDPLRISVVPQARPASRRSPGMGPEASMLMGNLGLRRSELPACDLISHQLKIGFEASFAELSLFLDALPGIRRAVTLKSLDTKQAPKGVSVELELEYYVQAS